MSEYTPPQPGEGVLGRLATKVARAGGSYDYYSSLNLPQATADGRGIQFTLANEKKPLTVGLVTADGLPTQAALQILGDDIIGSPTEELILMWKQGNHRELGRLTAGRAQFEAGRGIVESQALTHLTPAVRESVQKAFADLRGLASQTASDLTPRESADPRIDLDQVGRTDITLATYDSGIVALARDIGREETEEIVVFRMGEDGYLHLTPSAIAIFIKDSLVGRHVPEGTLLKVPIALMYQKGEKVVSRSDRLNLHSGKLHAMAESLRDFMAKKSSSIFPPEASNVFAQLTTLQAAA